MNARPLEGLTVLDFSTLLPGPMATLLLAEAGAEVLKVERPGRGEEMRSYQPRWGGHAVNFALLNRGKKSLAIDLKDPDARAKLQPAAGARRRGGGTVPPGRHGGDSASDYESLRRINSRIIYCSITGYGQSGPKREPSRPRSQLCRRCGAFSPCLWASPANPVLPPALVADIGGGAYPAVMNILLALAKSSAQR